MKTTRGSESAPIMEQISGVAVTWIQGLEQDSQGFSPGSSQLFPEVVKVGGREAPAALSGCSGCFLVAISNVYGCK